jgi:hypothetical protein
MAKKRQTSRSGVEHIIQLKSLRLAALAADLHEEISSREMGDRRGLTTALDACDAILEEFGSGPSDL